MSNWMDEHDAQVAVRLNSAYYSYVEAYRDATRLHNIMFDLWRSDLPTYTRIRTVWMDDRYGIQIENV